MKNRRGDFAEISTYCLSGSESSSSIFTGLKFPAMLSDVGSLCRRSSLSCENMYVINSLTTCFLEVETV